MAGLTFGPGREVLRGVLWAALAARRKYRLPLREALDAAIEWAHEIQRHGPDALTDAAARERHLALARSRRKTGRRVSAGMCVQCGTRPAAAGRIRCEECLERHRQYLRAWRRS